MTTVKLTTSTPFYDTLCADYCNICCTVCFVTPEAGVA